MLPSLKKIQPWGSTQNITYHKTVYMGGGGLSRKEGVCPGGVHPPGTQRLTTRINRMTDRCKNNIFTVQKPSCGKVMFLHLSVILFTGEGAKRPLGREGGGGCAFGSLDTYTHTHPNVNKRVVRILPECFLAFIIFIFVVQINCI